MVERKATVKQVIERVVGDLKANDLFIVDEESNVNDKEIEAAMSRASAPGRGGSFVGSVMVFGDFPEADIVDRALEKADEKRRQFKKDIEEVQKAIGKIERERGLNLDKIKEATEDLLDPMQRAANRGARQAFIRSGGFFFSS